MSNKVLICEWCKKPIHDDEPQSKNDLGDTLHLCCAAEEEDEIFFDRDMGFGDN